MSRVRVIARRLTVNINGFKVPSKTFCTDATANASSCYCCKSIDEKEWELNFANDAKLHDIAIVGGGMVGMALACSLATMPLTKHLNVAIVDSNPALERTDCIKSDGMPASRVSTVTPAAISFFKDMGVWEYVQQHRHAFFNKMQVWDYTGLGFTKYNARDADKDILGCVVENRVLHGSLLSRVQETDFQKTIYSSNLTSLTSASTSGNGHPVKLGLSDGSSLSAKLVVGADGAKSQVQQIAGFKTTGWKYPQSAITCTVEHPDENRCAWQRFLPAGPIALLPVGDNFSNIVWTTSPEEALRLKSSEDDEFVEAVNHALDHGYGSYPRSGILGNGGLLSSLLGDVGMRLSADECFEVPPRVVGLVGERVAFPLSLMHANEYALKRIVLVGDAAHTVHPLAGQGVNLGFGDALSLSKVIANGVALGSDIGELSLLKKYESERKAANATMMAILDGFQKAYSVDFGPLNLVRAAAFHGANHIRPLKRSIISFASGDQRFPFFA